MEGENLSEIRKTLPDSCKKKSKLRGFFFPSFHLLDEENQFDLEGN